MIVEAPTGESNKETQKQMNQKVHQKNTTRVTSTTPLLVLHSKPMRNQGESEVASPMKRLIRHVEGNLVAEGATDAPMTDVGPIKVRSCRQRPSSERPLAGTFGVPPLEP